MTTNDWNGCKGKEMAGNGWKCIITLSLRAENIKYQKKSNLNYITCVQHFGLSVSFVLFMWLKLCTLGKHI